jgi:Protein of unknown function (DUF3037)
MTSRYSVIQYVPNPIAGELINIGVLISDEQEVRVHFLQNWERVRCFGMSEDIDMLKNFAHEMQEVMKKGLLFPGDYPSDLPAHERLMKVACGWMNGIQVTEPRGSLASVDQLLEDMTQTYLLEPLQVVKNEDQISRIYAELDPILGQKSNYGFLEFIGESFHLMSKKSTNIIKNRNPFSNLRDSTSKFGMTFFEERYLPNIDDKILRTITEELSLSEGFSLKIVELYLSRINNTFEKDITNFWRALPYFLSLTIFIFVLLFTPKNTSIITPLLVSYIGFFLVIYYVRSYKNRMPSKIVLCLHILKEAQLIRDEREALERNTQK